MSSYLKYTHKKSPARRDFKIKMVGDTGFEPVTGDMPKGMASGNGQW